MGTSCTKPKKKNRGVLKEQLPAPPVVLSEGEGIFHYDPQPVKEISQGEVVVRILTPQPSSLSMPSEQIIPSVDEMQSAAPEDVLPEERGADTSQRHEGSMSQHAPLDQGSGAREDDEVVSVRSRSSQRSTRTKERSSFFRFLFRRDNPEHMAETKGAKSAAHPNRHKETEDFTKANRDDKDFPADNLDRVRDVSRDRLPLDILTRRTKVLNNLTKMGSLETLELRHCKLSVFPPQFKSAFIREINFSDNLIDSLPEAVFPTLLELESLNMSQNKLRSLPETLGECGKLKFLLVSRNDIKEVSSTMLMRLTELKILDLMNNSLEQLTFTLNSIPSVTELNCSKNHIGEVKNDFFDFVESKLEVLKLSLNPLKDIGESVLDLINLRRLDLRQTHIGRDHPTVMSIFDRNESDDGNVVKCLINQLLDFEAPVPLEPVAEEEQLDAEELEEEEKSVSKQVTDVGLHLEEDQIAAQTQVPVIEQPYAYPPEDSALHQPLKELVLQVNDNLHITLTLATIEKIVDQGIEAKDRGAMTVNLPLTCNYFMERIARYPSAINVLGAFKYQIREDASRGLILQPTAAFIPSRKSTRNSKRRKSFVFDKEKFIPRKSEKKEESIEELRVLLTQFKQSVGKLVEKEFEVPDYNAYMK